ncbi:MAG: T9SS type A sorting domain-containing protein [Bacteroidota bacterium]
MKTIKNILFVLLFVSFSSVQAQTESDLKTKYMITYDQVKDVFTAWIVPTYDTPNFNNPDTEEKGATAQFSLKVPRGFTLTSLTDLKGTWEKMPTRIGSQKGFLKANVDPQFEYYIIGKGNVETNYGTFKTGEPIAIFTFKGTGGDATKVAVLENNDPFVEIADKQFSLNVRNSFYSRSGQTTKSSAKPLEQDAGSTSLKEVLAVIASKVLKEVDSEGEYKVLAYPNPTSGLVNLKVFVEKENASIGIDIIDGRGISQQLSKSKGVVGINTLQVNLKNVQQGEYFLKTTIDDKIYTQKVIKVE